MPTFRELKRYVERNGWTVERTMDHWYYRKITDDGRILTTRISFSLGKEIPSYLWKKILSNQLCVSQEEFNRKI